MKFKSIFNSLSIALISSISGLSHAASDTGVAVKLSPPSMIELQIVGSQVTSPIGESIVVPFSATAVSLSMSRLLTRKVLVLSPSGLVVYQDR